MLLSVYTGWKQQWRIDGDGMDWQLRRQDTANGAVVQNQFCVVPFGLNISNAAFGKGLEAALNNYSIPCTSPNDIHTYVDDILLSSHSFESHLNTLEWIFHKIARVDPGKTIPSTPSLATPLVVVSGNLSPKLLPIVTVGVTVATTTAYWQSFSTNLVHTNRRDTTYVRHCTTLQFENDGLRRCRRAVECPGKPSNNNFHGPALMKMGHANLASQSIHQPQSTLNITVISSYNWSQTECTPRFVGGFWGSKKLQTLTYSIGKH
ncbi:hypothetical protein QTP88_014927 [Uroleucon formosanum]